MGSRKETKQFRKHLEARIPEVERSIYGAQQEAQYYALRNADPADQAAVEYERQAATHKALAARQRLKALKEALERLEQGTFGTCIECGNDIGQKRLQAIPWARYCVVCQEAHEQG